MSAKMVAGTEDIDESLRILLGTKFLERIMRPDYGCGLTSLVFENINGNTLTLLRDAIQRAVLFFEPRIDLESIEVDDGAVNEGKLYLTLHYKVRATNSRSNLVYPFYFLEGTNIQNERSFPGMG